jgi:hypothetical protein
VSEKRITQADNYKRYLCHKTPIPKLKAYHTKNEKNTVF